jgi:hypothetical protein
MPAIPSDHRTLHLWGFAVTGKEYFLEYLHWINYIYMEVTNQC